MEEPTGQPAPRRTRVFLSYSRSDRVFAEALRDRLIAEGFDSYLDVHDIVKGEPWRERLRTLIESADAMLFLVSPASVQSPVCDWEINEAELLGKRILPIVAAATPEESVPRRLQRLNYSFLDTPEKDAVEFPRLLAALREDALWVREKTRLLELALRWESAGRPGRLLLRGKDIDAAETWRDRRPADGPPPTALHAAFVASSRRHASRVLRYWVGSLAAGSIVVVLLAAGAIVQRDRAIEQRLTAEASEGALRSDALRPTAPEAALAAAVAAYDKKTIPAALGAVRRSIDTVILRRARNAAPLSAETQKATSGGRRSRWARSLDRSRVAIVEGDDGVQVLDGETLADVARLDLSGVAPEEIAMSAAGRFLAVADGSRRAALWTVAPGAVATYVEAPHEVEHLRFGRAEKVLALIGREAVTFYSLIGSKRLATIARPVVSGASVDFSPDDALAVLVGWANQAWIVDPVSGIEKSAFDQQAEAAALKPSLGGSDASLIARPYFLDDGRRVLTVGAHAYWTLWDASTGRPLHRARSLFDGSGTDWALIASASGTVVTEDGTNGEIVGWNLVDDTLASRFGTGHRGLIAAAAIDADGHLVATVGVDQDLVLWSVDDRRRLATWRVSQTGIEDAGFTPSGRSLLTLTHHGDAALWDVRAIRAAGRLAMAPGTDDTQFYGAEFSADGRRLVAGDGGPLVGVWDVARRERIAGLVGHEGAVDHVTLSRDGTRAATVGRDGTVRLWDAASGAELGRQAGRFHHAAFNDDATLLAVNDFDGRVRIIAVPGRDVVSEAKFEQSLSNAVAFSGDGQRYAVTGNDGTAIIAATSSGREIGRLRLPGMPFRRARFSADGDRLFTTHDDNVVRAWEIGKERGHGRMTAEMRGHAGLVPRFDLLADDRLLLSPSDDGSIRLWNVDDGALLRVFGGHVGVVRDAIFVDGEVLSVDGTGRIVRTLCDACRGERELLARARSKLQGSSADGPHPH